MVAETVRLVCHMPKGQFDIVHEYVDARESFLIRLGLKLLPLLCGSAIIEGDDPMTALSIVVERHLSTEGESVRNRCETPIVNRP